MVERERIGNWRGLVWRAWRNSDDEVFAGRLFVLVADDPVGGPGMVGLLATGLIYGAAAGLLLFLLLSAEGVALGAIRWDRLVLSLWLGGGAGTIVALVILLVLDRRLTWRQWLGLLTPNVALDMPTFLRPLRRVRQILAREQIFLLAGGLLGGLAGGPIGGLAGAWLFRWLHGLVCLIFPLSEEGASAQHAGWGGVVLFGMLGGMVGWLVTVFVGVLALLLGLGGGSSFVGGFALLFVLLLLGGQVVGLLLGLDPGLPGGLLFGLTGALLGGLFVALVTGPAGGLIAGLFIFLVNGLVSLIRASPHAWRWRWLWFWWRDPPTAARLEEALRQACVEQYAARRIWTEPLRRLDRRRAQLGPVGAFMTLLEHEAWGERFVARHTLVSLGGEAVEPLCALAQDADSPLQRTALWLLENIAADTTERLAGQAPRLLCPRCAVHCGEIPLEVSGRLLTYYGCRACGQSRGFVDWTGPVVAVLDVRMEEEEVKTDGTWWVNWLMRRQLFDFDWVEIVWAMDEEVERFALQVANDTDALRRPRYRQMRCVVAERTALSENTMRILDKVFGEVEVGQVGGANG